MSDTTVLIDGLAFPEGARWRGDSLFLSDMHADQVLRVTLDGVIEVIASVERPSGLGWLPDGRLLVVSMGTRIIWRLEPDGRLVEHADCSSAAPYEINDMVVDRHGRAFIGQFGYDAVGRAPRRSAPVVRADPDGTVHTFGDVMMANGLVVSRDDRVLIVAETYSERLTAFDVGADGTLTNQRVWAEFKGALDGICMDEQGAIWVATLDGMSFARVLEHGAVTDVVTTDGRRAFSCALGGPDGRTLFMLTSAGSTARDIAPTERLGQVETATVTIGGCERP